MKAEKRIHTQIPCGLRDHQGTFAATPDFERLGLTVVRARLHPTDGSTDHSADREAVEEDKGAFPLILKGGHMKAGVAQGGRRAGKR
jgi:hypothetical protein